jgi:hypothetical protein
MERLKFNSPKISGEILIQLIKENSIEMIILSSPVLKGNQAIFSENQAILNEPILTVSEEAYGSVVDIDTSNEAIKSLDISIIPLANK